MGVRYNGFFGRVANTVRIEVMETGLADLGRDWRSEDMCSPYSRLYYVISGRGYLRTRDGDNDRERAEDKAGDYGRERAEDKAGDYDRERAEDKAGDNDRERAEDKARDYGRERAEDKARDCDRERAEDKAGDYDRERAEDKAGDYDRERAGERVGEGRAEGNGNVDGIEERDVVEGTAAGKDRGGKIHVLRPGYVYLIPNGLSYDYFCEDRLEKAYFHINVLLQDRLELFYGCRDYYELPVGAAAVEQMKRWIVSDRPEDFFHIQGEIYHAVAAFMKMAGVEEKVERNYSEMVSRLFGLLPQLKVSVPVREMARSLNVSESTLAKRFRKETGMSIGDYRQQLAMSRARQLLALGKLSVGEIAEELGYCDQFYFCRYFKEHQGMTPSAYRQRYAGTYLH